MDGISSFCTKSLNIFVVCPFLMTRDLELTTLNFIRPNEVTSVRAVSILSCRHRGEYIHEAFARWEVDP